MFKKISKEVEVKTSITKAWEIYSTNKIAMIIQSEFAHLFSIVMEGDGGEGTLVKVTPRPGVPMPAYKERFTKIDHAKRVKEVDLMEGGYLDMGFTSYRVILKFMETEKEDSCILIVTVEYTGNEDVVANADDSLTFKPLLNIFEGVNRYIQNKLSKM